MPLDFNQNKELPQMRKTYSSNIAAKLKSMHLDLLIVYALFFTNIKCTEHKDVVCKPFSYHIEAQFGESWHYL